MAGGRFIKLLKPSKLKTLR